MLKLKFNPNQDYEIEAIQILVDIFPNSHTLCDQLSWSHYRLLLKVKSDGFVKIPGSVILSDNEESLMPSKVGEGF